MRGSLNMRCNVQKKTVVTLQKPCAPCELAVVGKWGARIILPIPPQGMRILKCNSRSCKMAFRVVDLVGMLNETNWQHAGCRTLRCTKLSNSYFKIAKKFLEYDGQMKLFWTFSLVTALQHKVVLILWFLKILVRVCSCVDKTCQFLEMSGLALYLLQSLYHVSCLTTVTLPRVLPYYSHFTMCPALLQSLYHVCCLTRVTLPRVLPYYIQFTTCAALLKSLYHVSCLTTVTLPRVLPYYSHFTTCACPTTVTLPRVLPYSRSGRVLVIGLLQFWIFVQILWKNNCCLGLKLVFEHSHHFVEECILLYLQTSALSLSTSKVSSLIGAAVH